MLECPPTAMKLENMSLFKYIILPFSLMNAVFFGHDRLQAILYMQTLHKSLHEAVMQESKKPNMMPETMVRNALQQQTDAARKRREVYTFEFQKQSKQIIVKVQSQYFTKISHNFGVKELPVHFTYQINVS
jgi:hypothetical protein